MLSRYFNSKSKFSRLFGVGVCVFVALRCAWLWQPERQLLLHQRHFLDAVEDRKWSKIEAFLSNDFRDRFGHDKTWALRESREILRQFFALTVHDSETRTAWSTPTRGSRSAATVQARLRIEGTGTPIAQYAMEAVNQAREPFAFSWKQQSWKPWDWQLTTVDHPLMAHDTSGF